MWRRILRRCSCGCQQSNDRAKPPISDERGKCPIIDALPRLDETEETQHMAVDARTIEALLQEGRSFPPSAEFRATARVTDDSLHREAEADLEGFWKRQAEKYVDWFKPFDSVLRWDLPFARWFEGG